VDEGETWNTKLKVCFWNVCGWLGGGGEQMERRVQEHEMRAEVIDYYKPDVLALAETWLKRDEVINVQGYKCFVHNRKQLNKKAKRGSGGVGVLIRDDFLYRYTVEVIDSDVEVAMWVKMCSTQGEEARLLIAVCYIPPEASSSGNNAKEKMQLLSEQVEKYTPLGPLIFYGDSNARCGYVHAGGEVTTRCTVDPGKNRQEEALNDLVRSTGLCIVNGTKGKDAFTCVSSRGSSVVDYCIVPCGNQSI